MINTPGQNSVSVLILDSVNNIQMKLLKKARIKSSKISRYFTGINIITLQYIFT
jgi:hypothetical protein